MTMIIILKQCNTATTEWYYEIIRIRMEANQKNMCAIVNFLFSFFFFVNHSEGIRRKKIGTCNNRFNAFLR